LEDNKPTGKLVASNKLSLWIRQQLSSAAEYVPFKGGRCNLCGRFCKTTSTRGDGVRYHNCSACGITFKTIYKNTEEAD
jgi:hypothetical protein